MTELINLIYGSSAKYPMKDAELLDILAKAREKNRRLGVTGMLLYRGGNFLQVLEGERSVVEPLYKVIQRDPRHHLTQLFTTRSVPQRGFGEWEMGFAHLDTMDVKSLPGYTSFLDEPLNSDRFNDPSFAHIFLRIFKEGIR
ncbi:MAG: BLUF domain-containing protein [Anaerolineae bacterium]|nr:BLUF domain-containing protein [Anaerolineae bacterium]